MRISIIIPIYNCENYVEQCLRSVFRQSIKELEIICIDDGSTDHSVQIVKKLQSEDARIILFQQENQGSGIARNLGIRKAHGKYIAFLDADDYYVDDNALEILADTCEKKGVPVCACIRRHVKDGREYVKDIFSEREKDSVLYYRNHQMDYFYQNYLFQRELLVCNGIVFPGYRRYQDPPFFVNALYTAEFFAVADTCLYCYRVPDIDTRYDRKKIEGLLHGILDNLLFAKERELEVLFRNTVDHLEYEYAYVIYKNLSADNLLRILEILMKINQLISTRYKAPHYIVKPLRLMLFSAEQYEKRLSRQIKAEEGIALYGAGKLTKAFLGYLKGQGMLEKVRCIVVSDLKGNASQVEEISVISLQQFLKGSPLFLLVTVGKKLAIEITDGLERIGYTHYEVLDDIFGDILLKQ